MSEAAGVLAIIVLFIIIFVRDAIKSHDSPPSPRERLTIRCPNCGSPAEVKGSWWECGWCGDSGRMKR